MCSGRLRAAFDAVRRQVVMDYPEQLLDAAFYTLAVIEKAAGRYGTLCRGEQVS